LPRTSSDDVTEEPAALESSKIHLGAANWRSRPKAKSQMIKPKRTAEQQVADEAERRALNPLTSRQKISESQAEPEFRENHRRLKADRLAREARVRGK
jgi:hypothetical protein